jgi:hypothetical protein
MMDCGEKGYKVKVQDSFELFFSVGGVEAN